MTQGPEHATSMPRRTAPSGSRWRRVLFAVLYIGLPLLLWACVIKIEMHALAPPSDAKTFERFSEAMPPATHLAEVTRGGELLIVWIGEYCGPVFLPSGPSCYVFDSTGILRDWTPDTGDGSRFDELASLAGRSPNRTVDEIRTILLTQSGQANQVP